MASPLCSYLVWHLACFRASTWSPYKLFFHISSSHKRTHTEHKKNLYLNLYKNNLNIDSKGDVGKASRPSWQVGTFCPKIYILHEGWRWISCSYVLILPMLRQDRCNVRMSLLSITETGGGAGGAVPAPPALVPIVSSNYPGLSINSIEPAPPQNNGKEFRL